MALIGCATLMLAGCGRFGDSMGDSAGDSSWNPTTWFGSSQPKSLEPEGGYPTTTQDNRSGIAYISGAKWEPMYEGRLLVVTGLPATKGWWNAALITEEPMPRGRIRADDMGVLRLRFVAYPPLKDSAAARSAPNPASDTITVGLTIPKEALSGINQVVISGAGNVVTLNK
ncbi:MULTISPECIES: hypothetical protein [Paracoccus]|nr:MULTISPECIES: hypothetical protein [Paracoccus]